MKYVAGMTGNEEQKQNFDVENFGNTHWEDRE